MDRALAAVPNVRQVVVELSTGERRTPGRDREELLAVAAQVTDLRSVADHAALMPLLPSLLLDIAGHGVGMAPQLIEVVDAGVYALKAVGHTDLARSVVEVALPIVREFDTVQWIGQAHYTWVQSFPPECAALGSRIARRAADELQGSSDSEALQVYGHLHLMSAFEAAVSLRADDAQAHLDEADHVARTLGEPRRAGR